ncbi:MAG: carbamoyl-phosphate synthase large subunit, partial [Gammaproteobacteria bacterium]|nr:carbamoyl-phosphate synthase large subunit [Gammaproteobacteria bacterium]
MAEKKRTTTQKKDSEVHNAEGSIDTLYRVAESLAQDFSLFPRKETASVLQGAMTDEQIEEQLKLLQSMDVDAYIEAVVKPVEDTKRPGAKDIIRSMNQKIIMEIEDGPFYSAELEMDFGHEKRRVGVIAQNRKFNNGVWGPSHHEQAAEAASRFAIRSIPIVNMIDTPGADANENANANNQAHTISRLIAELCNVDVPTIGIVLGQGYSGGAIPLAASNLLLSLRTGVFNTIHPRGLANLVRRYNLSWQECAKFVGVSPFELYKQGNIDGIIDYEPGEDDKVSNLENVIISGITFIEENTREFVAEHPEIIDHYKRNLKRYLHPSETLAAVHASSTLKLRTSPTEWPNLFGVAFRYLRYLGLRKRIRSMSTTQYGRLAASELPKGELQDRVSKERRAAFLGWLQDPDHIIYEDALNKIWKNFKEKKAEIDDERGKLAQLIFGEPKRNFDNALADLCLVSGLHLYNRWKASANDNLIALIDYLGDVENNQYMLRPSDIRDQKGLLDQIVAGKSELVRYLADRFSYEAKRLLDPDFVDQKADSYLRGMLVSELNMIIEGPNLINEGLSELVLSDATRSLASES